MQQQRTISKLATWQCSASHLRSFRFGPFFLPSFAFVFLTSFYSVFLSAFRRIRITAERLLAPSACLSVRVKQFENVLTYFHEI
jgi:hypothetical protein